MSRRSGIHEEREAEEREQSADQEEGSWVPFLPNQEERVERQRERGTEERCAVAGIKTGERDEGENPFLLLCSTHILSLVLVLLPLPSSSSLPLPLHVLQSRLANEAQQQKSIDQARAGLRQGKWSGGCSVSEQEKQGSITRPSNLSCCSCCAPFLSHCLSSLVPRLEPRQADQRRRPRQCSRSCSRSHRRLRSSRRIVHPRDGEAFPRLPAAWDEQLHETRR